MRQGLAGSIANSKASTGSHWLTKTAMSRTFNMQLGAYDQRAIAPGQKMHFFKTTSTAEFSVPVTSIKYGDEELLDFATGALRPWIGKASKQEGARRKEEGGQGADGRLPASHSWLAACTGGPGERGEPVDPPALPALLLDHGQRVTRRSDASMRGGAGARRW